MSNSKRFSNNENEWFIMKMTYLLVDENIAVTEFDYLITIFIRLDVKILFKYQFL